MGTEENGTSINDEHKNFKQETMLKLTHFCNF